MSEPAIRPHEEAVVARVIAEEQRRREHLVIALSGAHAYGFASPDSDLDLKAVHIDPSDAVLGFGSGLAHAERMEQIQGVEIDYSSNELKPVLSGVVRGNGNYLERILGRTLLFASPDLAPLQPLVRAALSRRVFRHYLGFATSQLEAFRADGRASAKKLLYVLRTALTGAHALLTGEIVTDLGALASEHGFGEARELILAKRAGEKTRLRAEQAERWSSEVTRALAVLTEAHARSSLPDEPPNVRELEAWLVAERKRRF